MLNGSLGHQSPQETEGRNLLGKQTGSQAMLGVQSKKSLQNTSSIVSLEAAAASGPTAVTISNQKSVGFFPSRK